MSVDYLLCDNCGEKFPDCGCIVSCCCGKTWCGDKCALEHGYINNCEEEDDNFEEENTSCSFCRGELFDDTDIINYLLKKNCMTLEQVINELKLKKERKGK